MMHFAIESLRAFPSSTCNVPLPGNKKYVCGDQYTIADMAIFPWIAGFVDGIIYGEAQEFLQVKDSARRPGPVESSTHSPRFGGSPEGLPVDCTQNPRTRSIL